MKEARLFKLESGHVTSQITHRALTKYTAGDGDFRLDRKEGMSCNKPFTLV